jgi:SAM-dependent methyltransferase
MTTFEKAYFDTNYRDYDRQNQPPKLNFYLRNLELHARKSGPLDILEVGCGLGRFLQYLHEQRPQHRLHATDISEYGVSQSLSKTPSATIRQASAEDQPFANESFDCICSFDVCEHVTNLDGVYRSIHAMLRPGGIFVLVVPVYDGLSGPLIRLLDKDPTHVHKVPRDFWLKWGASDMELVDYIGVVRYLLPWGYYLHLTTRFWRRHTPAVLAVFRK